MLPLLTLHARRCTQIRAGMHVGGVTAYVNSRNGRLGYRGKASSCRTLCQADQVGLGTNMVWCLLLAADEPFRQNCQPGS